MTTFDYFLGRQPVVIHAPRVGELDDAAADHLFDTLSAEDVVGLDVETTAHEKLGPLHRDFRVRTVQVATVTEAWVLRLDDDVQAAYARLILAEESRRFASHTRYDVLAVRRQFDLDISDRWVDTRLLARMAFPLSMDRHRKREGADMVDLKTLTTRYLGPQLAEMDKALDELFMEMWVAQGGRRNAKKQAIIEHGFNNVDLADDTFAVYAGLDAIACRALFPRLVELAKSTPELLGMEFWLAGWMTRQQFRGMRVDADRLAAELAEAKSSCDAAEEALVEKVGLTPRQGAKLVAWFREHGVDFEAHDHPRTKGGAPSLGGDEIKPMLDYDLTPEARAVVELLLAYKERENAKSKTEEMAGLVELSFDGRLHPVVDSLGAITSRMTASAPNIQNYAKKDPRMRAVLLADPGMVLIGADFDQIELRVLAALAQEPVYLNAIEAGDDLHQVTADAIHVERQVGKVINFLQAYGGGAGALAEQAGIPLVDAQAATAMYREAYQAVTEYSYSLQNDDHIRTITHRFIPATFRGDEYALYRFLNYMIQSSARDVLVLAMFRMWAKGWGDYLFVPIHDELIFQVPEDRVEEALADLQEAMTMQLFGVPISAKSVALIDADGVSRWMTCDRAEKLAKARMIETAA